MKRGFDRKTRIQIRRFRFDRRLCKRAMPGAGFLR